MRTSFCFTMQFFPCFLSYFFSFTGICYILYRTLFSSLNLYYLFHFNFTPLPQRQSYFILLFLCIFSLMFLRLFSFVHFWTDSVRTLHFEVTNLCIYVSVPEKENMFLIALKFNKTLVLHFLFIFLFDELLKFLIFL